MVEPCPGTLIWHDIEPVEGRWPQSCVVECTGCDYIVGSSNFHDQRHNRTEMIKGGMPT